MVTFKLSVKRIKVFQLLTASLLFVAVVGCGNKTTTESVETKTEYLNGLATSTFKVWGNCEMCKETIEGSLTDEAIKSASWDVDTKMITISYDEKKITLDQLQQKIAAVGYDNIKYKGNDLAYGNLAACCQYERK